MKIVVGGQLRKEEIKELANKLRPKDEVVIMSDLEGALCMQSGECSLYLGACDTGGGGALAIAVSLLGTDKAKTVATQSSIKSEDEIKKMIDEGTIAFGFVESAYKDAAESILKNWKD